MQDLDRDPHVEAAAILLGFLNYLPFSKHIHVLGSGPNIFFRIRDRSRKSAVPRAKLFDGAADDPDAEPLFENWGVGVIEHFVSAYNSPSR